MRIEQAISGGTQEENNIGMICLKILKLKWRIVFIIYFILFRLKE
jgi:hypothetical protein